MIQVSNLKKIYQTADLRTTALNNVDLIIERGEFVAVMGPSGCGKSTLMNILGMIDTPSSGSYLFDGQEIGQFTERQLVDLRKENLGFIFQSFNLIDELTVAENIELPLRYRKVSRAQRKNRVREVLELVGLRSRVKHKPSQLSGGQQQRVAVARAIVGDPKFILADEPTGNLDSMNGNDVMEMFEILKDQGATILMVTHSPSDAQRADRIIHMFDGQVVAEGPPGQPGLRTGNAELAQ